MLPAHGRQAIVEAYAARSRIGMITLTRGTGHMPKTGASGQGRVRKAFRVCRRGGSWLWQHVAVTRAHHDQRDSAHKRVTPSCRGRSPAVALGWLVRPVLLLVLGCQRGDGANDSSSSAAKSQTPADGEAEPTPSTSTPVEPRIVGKTFPHRRDHRDYAGADACQPCHGQIYATWKTSPHGRAMATPEAPHVLGNFGDVTVQIPGGTARCFKDGEAFAMDIAGPQGSERHRVDLVLASGRQHQVYLTKTGNDYAMLPLIWLTPTQTWIASSAYVPSSADESSASYWKRAEMLNHRCFDCHLSQVQVSYTDSGPATTWINLPVNCESCHGPGRAHITARQRGETDTTYGDLRTIGKNDEIDICSKCHGSHLPLQVDGTHASAPLTYYMTLADEGFRSDGTQRGVSYQYAGHMVGPCYLRADLKCSSCHAPHSGLPRDLAGRSARGEFSNRQCTACHPQFIDPARATEHSHHAGGVRCIDCHMSYSWIHDDPALVHRTSDHSISTPRPRESLLFGNPNACTTCHDGKTSQWALTALESWGSTQATEVRHWVEAFSRARRGEQVVDQLIAVLDDPALGEFVHRSALRLLQEQRPDPKLVDVFTRYVERVDPRMRFEALYGLMTHDGHNAGQWRARAMADPQPLVPLMTFAHAPNGNAGELEQFFERIRRHSIMPPFDLLFATATLLVARGEREAAGRVLDMARSYAPQELKKQIPRVKPTFE